MLHPYAPAAAQITRMADGTVKQVNPFTGTEVWTVPGRGNRPLGVAPVDPKPLDPARAGHYCAFCQGRYDETPPEKSRVVRRADGQWDTLHALPATQLNQTVAEFRRIPNLFEIVSYDYWRANYGYVIPEAIEARKQAYLASPEGAAHVMKVVHQRLRAAGLADSDWEQMSDEERLSHATGFFGGGHDVIVARRHYVDGATTDDQLCGSGSLTQDEHARYLNFTVESMKALYDNNPYARYVAVFQNWLKPAGASFDHLHKQMVAIDERGVQAELELQKVRANPNLFNEAAVNYAQYNNLVFAENDHAVALAGFGHRYPTLEIYSRSAVSEPWGHSPDELAGMSDLVHACHAAAGPHLPCNEEWHHRPADVDMPMPWRVLIKWRVSTLAGFEGGTKIYLNTIDPWTLRDRVVPRLFELRAQGAIAGDLRIATECRLTPNPLRYRQIGT